MLEELDIRDLAVAEHVRVRLAPGFNVITGETGAGKSIIIDALGLLLGARADSDAVRAGARAARVEGVFRLPDSDDPALTEALAQAGATPEDGLLIISRDVPVAGRSVARINGRAVLQGALAALGRHLVDIHGQADHLSILRPTEQLDMLDRFGRLTEQRAAVGRLAGALRQTRAAIADITANQRERARRQERLAFEVDEIDAAQLRAEEEDELRAERTLLANAEELARLADTAQVKLTGGERRGGAVDALGAVAAALAQLARLDPRLAETATQAEALQSQLYDLARDLREYREGVEYNPRRLEQVEERLALVNGLKRKYGATVAEVLAYAEQARAELADLTTSDEQLAALRADDERTAALLAAAAEALARERRAAAAALAAAVERELHDLRLAGGRFAVRLSREPSASGVRVTLPAEETVGGGEASPDSALTLIVAYDSSGVDHAEFWVSLNPGEPLRPLAKVASGGETARLMLALKSILGGADAVPTLVFDEVDVGVGGRSGDVIGRKLAALGDHHQVLCITHLAQVAARARHHLIVAKHVQDGRTFTDVRSLEGAERPAELAAMLGGASAANLRAARELLEAARITEA